MKTLVLIEDHAPFRRDLRDILTLEGFEVLEAGSGEEGLSLILEHRPALVLSDIMLPGMDGLAVLASVRADPRTRAIPLILLTARGEAPDVRTGMNLGADDYLPKPVSRADLLASIRTRLDRSGAQRRGLPDFSNPAPLLSLGLSAREAEVLLWLAQGKGNEEIAVIIECSPATVKKHVLHIFEKLSVESRGAAMLVAIEALAS